MILKSIFDSKKIILTIAGAFGALAFAPFDFPLVLFVSFPLFFIFLERTKFGFVKKTGKKINFPWSIFWLGFAFGFGHFLAGIYWISISLLVDAASFAWLIPFALTIIPGILAIYIGLFAVSYKFITSKMRLEQDYQKIILFALLWLLFEVLRSNLFSGFPWNLIGYSWLFDVEFAQLGSVFGIYGLSLLAILTALFPLPLFAKKITRGDKIFVSAIVIFLCGNLLFAHFYIDDAKIITDHQSKLRLVQANIKQEMKWDEKQKYEDFFRQIKLTDAENAKDVKAVIWSETAVPYVLDDNPVLLLSLARAVPQDGVLITGALRVENKNAWNSIFVINQKGVVDHYDKHRLVPFGEFVPLHRFLSFLFLDKVVDGITGGGSGFSSGAGAQTLKTEKFSFSPLVCYEAIFSDDAVDHQNLPELFVNLTNDAWFGDSSGPYQHFNMARMRAIEYGTPFVRVANTGITALIDPFGRVVRQINLNQTGTIDVELIKNSSATIYGTYRCLPLLLFIVALVSFLIFPIHPWKSVRSHRSINISPKN